MAGELPWIDLSLASGLSKWMFSSYFLLSRVLWMFEFPVVSQEYYVMENFFFYA